MSVGIPEERFCPAGSVRRFVLPFAAIGKPRMTRRDRFRDVRPEIERYRAWADRVRGNCLVNGIPSAESVLLFSWCAIFAVPKSYTKKARLALLGEIHRVKPDRDNIDKALCDVMWERDQAIGVGRQCKLWGEINQIEIEIIYSAED